MANQSNQYPNSGTLFVRDKRSPKAADYGGDFTLDGEVLDYVLRSAERGQPVKLEISGWKRQGRNNTTFISLKLDTPYAERSNNQSRQQPAQQRTMTSRGEYPSSNYGGGKQTNGYATQTRGSEANQRFRQELNDDIPDNFGGSRQQGRPQKNGWDE